MYIQLPDCQVTGLYTHSEILTVNVYNCHVKAMQTREKRETTLSESRINFCNKSSNQYFAGFDLVQLEEKKSPAIFSVCVQLLPNPPLSHNKQSFLPLWH